MITTKLNNGKLINLTNILIALLYFFKTTYCLRQYTKQDIHNLREEVRTMFQHAYNGYLTYAVDYDELRPLSCDGVNTWGSYSLTLIDALDTLAVMGNYTEFQRVTKILTEKINFDSDINVSVFETNIRIVGGLISAHLLSNRAGVELEPGWPCNGPLLRLAEDVAKRLLPAFDTKTGMPYGTVNLRSGVPAGETSVTCTAGVGTFIIEFGALSRLTGDPIYEEVALNALHALFKHKSAIGLFGNHIDVQTGRWTAQDAGIGAGVDSYYEYLVKGSLMLNRPELMEMFYDGKKSIDKYLKRDDWHVWVGMNKGQVTLPVFQSLEAYWPGVLSLIGDTIPAMKTLHNYHTVWKQYGFLPEFYNIPNAEAGANRENYPLRPELIESVMYLYRSTGDPYLLEVGEDMLRSIEHSAKTPCGYATIKNVRDHRKEDRMESFFLAETTKYLYLLFDPDNFLNNNGQTGQIIETPNGQCIIDAGGYIFNTEAHPIDPAALQCCYEVPGQNLLSGYDTNKYLGDIFQITPFESETDISEDKYMQKNLSTTTTTISIQTKIDPEETRKNIVAEIMNVLKENKFMRENGQTEIMEKDYGKGWKKGREAYDSLVYLVDKKATDEETATPDVTVEDPVEVIKLPPTRDSDENKSKIVDPTDFLSYEDDDNTSSGVEETTKSATTTEAINTSAATQTNLTNFSNTSNQIKNIFNQDKLLETAAAVAAANNSMITEFVQSILKSTLPTKPKFDAQALLEKIRTNNLHQNHTKSNDYKLLTCKTQSYLQRITVLGEFF